MFHFLFYLYREKKMVENGGGFNGSSRVIVLFNNSFVHLFIQLFKLNVTNKPEMRKITSFIHLFVSSTALISLLLSWLSD